jgi:DNA-binding transcriptional LysR family regulator
MAIVDDTVSTESVVNALELHPLCVDVSDAVISSKHRLASRKSIQLSELASERWAMSQSSGSFPYRSLLAKACVAAGFTPNVTASCSLPVALEMVRTAGAVAVLPRLALRHLKADGDFKIVRIEPPIQRSLLLAIPKGGSRRPAVEAVMQALRYAVQDTQPRQGSRTRKPK